MNEPVPPNERTQALVLQELGIPIEIDEAQHAYEGDRYWLQDGQLRRRVGEYLHTHRVGIGDNLGGLHMYLRRNTHFPTTKASPDWDKVDTIVKQAESTSTSVQQLDVTRARFTEVPPSWGGLPVRVVPEMETEFPDVSRSVPPVFEYQLTLADLDDGSRGHVIVDENSPLRAELDRLRARGAKFLLKTAT